VALQLGGGINGIKLGNMQNTCRMLNPQASLEIILDTLLAKNVLVQSLGKLLEVPLVVM